jgi:hypothetical protein
MSTRTDGAQGKTSQGVDRRRLMLMGGVLASGLLADSAKLFAQGDNDGPDSKILALNLGKIHERLEVPATINPSMLKKDCEKILSLLQKSPNDFQEIVAKLHSGDHQGARKVVLRLGLTEESLSSQGGGFWHFLLVLAAAYLLGKLK